MAYNVVEAVVALAAGTVASSIALVGFGLDSGIETLAAVVVLMRLRDESRTGDPDAHEATERRAERVVGGTLLALAVYVSVEAVRNLVTRHTPEASPVGIALTAVSLVLMPFLAWAKYRTGKALGSRALVADSKETLICSYLSLTLLIGLTLNAWQGWWWADPAAALAMAPYIAYEGWEAWRGEHDHD